MDYVENAYSMTLGELITKEELPKDLAKEIVNLLGFETCCKEENMDTSMTLYEHFKDD